MIGEKRSMARSQEISGLRAIFILHSSIIGLCCTVGMMIKRISPKTYAVLTGGRV